MPPTGVGARRQGGTHWADLGSSRAAAGFRTSDLNHAVENSDADGSLDLLAGQLAGVQVVAENALVPCHRAFPL
jgi:hypothetical protein